MINTAVRSPSSSWEVSSIVGDGSLVVVIPAFREAGGIGEVIRRVRCEVPDARVIVVDDGSPDATGIQAAAAGADVVRHAVNMGYGVAVQTGLLHALDCGGRYILLMDADGQHDPGGIPALLAPVLTGNADLVLGSRFLSGSGSSYRPSWIRRAGMRFFATLCSKVLGQPITDSTSGFQAMTPTVARFFTSDVFPVDYPDADMLIALHFAGFRISEVPARMHANTVGKSMHGGVLRPLYYIFKMSLSILLTLSRRRELERLAREEVP
ncbi:MAG: glycosyltransferase family 2 protein [Planctomycetes bacterium]|nr:glycosyltransferase family 2 protein [Planctomycetota bacterium]